MNNKSQKKFKKNTVNAEIFENFQRAFNKFNPSELEKDPKNIKDIYIHYNYVDDMYIWLKQTYENSMCVLSNEIRAILGHISEYDIQSDKGLKNLEKAGGHLRRLSIDTLKILCDGFDKTFLLWINKYSKFDYSNIDQDYLPEYVNLYNEAHTKYLDVQKNENLGSDKENAIIVKYYATAQLYCELYKHHQKERRLHIEKMAKRFRINKLIWIFSTGFFAAMSIISVLI